nr:hypothetical protein [Kibdelosporangium aridum]
MGTGVPLASVRDERVDTVLTCGGRTSDQGAGAGCDDHFGHNAGHIAALAADRSTAGHARRSADPDLPRRIASGLTGCGADTQRMIPFEVSHFRHFVRPAALIRHRTLGLRRREHRGGRQRQLAAATRGQQQEGRFRDRTEPIGLHHEMLPVGLGDVTGGRAYRQGERGRAIPAVRQCRLGEIRPLRDGVQRFGGDACRGSSLQPKHNLAVAGELEPAAVRDQPMLLGRILHDGARVLAENSFRGRGIADHERHSGRHGHRLGRNHAHRPRAVGQLLLGGQGIRGSRDADRKATGFGVQCALTYLGQRAAAGEKS